MSDEIRKLRMKIIMLFYLEFSPIVAVFNGAPLD